MKAGHIILICILSFLCYRQMESTENISMKNNDQERIIVAQNDLDQNSQKERHFDFDLQRPLFITLTESCGSTTTLLRTQLESQRILFGQRIQFAIKNIVKSYSQMRTFERCKLLQIFTHHPFQSTLQPPSLYYIFAMRRILV